MGCVAAYLEVPVGKVHHGSHDDKVGHLAKDDAPPQAAQVVAQVLAKEPAVGRSSSVSR